MGAPDVPDVVEDHRIARHVQCGEHLEFRRHSLPLIERRRDCASAARTNPQPPAAKRSVARVALLILRGQLARIGPGLRSVRNQRPLANTGLPASRRPVPVPRRPEWTPSKLYSAVGCNGDMSTGSAGGQRLLPKTEYRDPRGETGHRRSGDPRERHRHYSKSTQRGG
jgi:hypothetical protein